MNERTHPEQLQLSERLRQTVPAILKRWEARVRTSLPDAEREAPLVLGSVMPDFLNTLADALAAPEQEFYTTHKITRPSQHPIYQALHEYRVLRGVLLEVLQEQGLVAPRERAIIHEAIDHGMEGEGLGFAETHEQARAGQDELNRLLIENARDYAIFTLDLERRVLTWNPGAERITGYSAEEMIGQSGDLIFTPEDRECGAPEHEQQTARREGRAENERWHQRKDGTRFFASGVTMPLWDGEVQGLAKVMRDVTDRKQMEQALQERTDELVAADQRKNEFLAMLAHELRNPLSPILNAVEVMRLRGAGDPVLHKSRDVVERQVRHMARLVDDLLDVSRITQGKIELRRGVVDLAAVVENATASCQSLLQARHHRLWVSAPRGIHAEADATRLDQVICNLLTNAAKYTEPGGQVWVSLQREGEQAVLRVRDTGVGIPQDMLRSIFEVFTQVNPSIDRAQGGLGLGLNLTQRLVELHGGTVEAHSEGPGQGSEFVVRLPALPDAALADAGGVLADGERAAPSAGVRVLIVEDNVDAAETLADLLPLWGHEVRVVHHGPAALTAATDFRPTVVLLDIGLPGMDGYEVARQLRRQKELEPLTLVALTGYGHADARRTSSEAGFDLHLTKPADPEALRRVLTRIAAT